MTPWIHKHMWQDGLICIVSIWVLIERKHNLEEVKNTHSEKHLISVPSWAKHILFCSCKQIVTKTNITASKGFCCNVNNSVISVLLYQVAIPQNECCDTTKWFIKENLYFFGNSSHFLYANSQSHLIYVDALRYYHYHIGCLWLDDL